MAIYWNRSWSSVTETWSSAVGNWGNVGYEPAVVNLVLSATLPNIPIGIGVGKGDLSLAGFIPIEHEDMPHVIPGAADLVLLGYAPAAAEGRAMFPPKGDLVFSSTAAGIGITYRFPIEKGDLVLAGQEPDPQHRAPKFKPSIQII